MKESITIYIADDHQIIIDGLTLLLKSEENIIIIGHSNNGQKAYNDIINLKPDIALLDLRMPEKDGLQVIKTLKNKSNTKFIILSMFNDRRYINDAMNYGAMAYLLKNTGKEILLKTIYEVVKGGICFPEIQKPKDQKETFLTPRELDILKLVITEHTSQQIAQKLSLSQFTVDTHRKSILKKLKVKNLAGLVKYAIDNGISFDNYI
ncbi:MAG: response regulator transcription factor [Bacteroidota bacterium]|nr:response regulator transcription factor [Bacteroidota bacterium]